MDSGWTVGQEGQGSIVDPGSASDGPRTKDGPSACFCIQSVIGTRPCKFIYILSSPDSLYGGLVG